MALTTFADLVTELGERGFQHLSATRQGHYVNVGYTELCEQTLWPFLLASTTGTAPLTIADLRVVESVEDTTNNRKLVPIDRRMLTDAYPDDLARTGTPDFYYFTGQTQISVFPANTGVTIGVKYWKVPTELSGVLEPVVPLRYRQAIVDYAVARAYSDVGDGERALAALQEGDRLVAFMHDSLVDAQADGSSVVVGGDGQDWG